MSEGEVDRAKANLLSDLEADLAEREQVGICLSSSSLFTLNR